MAFLINSTEEIQNHVTVLSSFDFDRAKPYIRKAERNYIIPLISEEEYQYFIDNQSDDLSSKKKVRELIEEATVNLAFHLGFSVLKVHIGNYGITDTDVDEAKQSSWADKRDLQRTFIRDGNKALDDALKTMENYFDEFPHWRASNSFTVLNEHFNRHTDDFQLWFNIHNSRQTFLALRPTIREVHEKYFLPLLGDSTINLIKTRTTNTVITRALELCQKAEAAHTIAEIAKTGTFEVTETGFLLRWETLPWEKAYKDVDLKKLDRLSKAKETAGEEYLKKLKKLIEENMTLFPDYTIQTKTSGIQIIKTKSGLAI